MNLGMLMVNAFDIVDRCRKPGNVAIMVGGRGSGKTASSFWIAEESHEREGRPYYAVGLPPEARKVLPEWVLLARDMADVPNGSFVILEESALLYKARKSFSEANLILIEIIDIARHKELSLIFITQSSATVDVNILRLGDTLIIKEPSLLQVELERRQVKRVFEKAAMELEKIPETDRKAHAYIIDTQYEGIVDTGLPSFWSDELSRLYASYSPQENSGMGNGTLDAVRYYCGGIEEFGLCPTDPGQTYEHKFSKNKPKVVMDEGKLFIMGHVQVGQRGIEDFAGTRNDFVQLQTPGEVVVLGELVALTVDGQELITRDAVLATNQKGDSLYVVERAQIKTAARAPAK